MGVEKVISESLPLKAPPGPAWVVYCRTPPAGSTPSGPHISKRHISPHLLLGRTRGHTKRPFAFIPAMESSNCPYRQGPPVFSQSSLLLDPTPGGPSLGVEWEEGSLSSLPHLHVEPTITSCCTQARAGGRSSGVGSEGYSPQCREGLGLGKEGQGLLSQTCFIAGLSHGCP